MAQALAVNLADVERELAERSLRDFLEFIVWPVTEPSTQFIHGFHIDAICEHLEAVSKREIRNLLITVPPRHTKSLCTSVAWPVWSWIAHPEARFLFASFSSELSTEHAVLSRRVIESPLFQRHWGDRFAISTDQNVKTHYENDRRGYRISTSVRGTTTGRGGDFLIADDLHNLKDIDSIVKRHEVIKWRREVWSSRLNNPKTGCNVVIMQRGHQTDVAADVLKDGYEHLCLPTEFEVARRCTTSIGWSDPRTKEGELLNPDRFGPVEIAKAKQALLSAGFATQHQQRPMLQEGGMFKRARFKVLSALEMPTDEDGDADTEFDELRCWDFAATEPEPGRDPDYTAGVKMRHYFNRGMFVVVDVVWGRWDPAPTEKKFFDTTEADGMDCMVREEQEGGSSGKRIIAINLKRLPGYDYKGVPSTGSKIVRATAYARQVDGGNVFLLEAPWNDHYVDEMAMFPKATHDDQVDASSGAFNELVLAPDQFGVMESTWG